MPEFPLTAHADVVYSGIYNPAQPALSKQSSADVYVTTEQDGQRRLAAAESHDIERRSEDFEWGYNGAGPYQLAVGLLTDALRQSGVTDPEQIRRVLDTDTNDGKSIPRQFADDVTCVLPKDERWELTHRQIVNHINHVVMERTFERRLANYFTQQLDDPRFVEGIAERMARLAMLDPKEVRAEFNDRLAAYADEIDAKTSAPVPAGPGMG